MPESKSAKTEGLMYKGHPLRRVENLIYYGTMAEKYIIMMQVLESKKEQDLNVAKMCIRDSLHRTGAKGTLSHKLPCLRKCKCDRLYSIYRLSQALARGSVHAAEMCIRDRATSRVCLMMAVTSEAR